jgi:threonine aldolase
VQTNIIIISVEPSGKQPEEILSLLKAKGVLLTLGNYMGIRAVTHLDVSLDEVREASRAIRETIH